MRVLLKAYSDHVSDHRCSGPGFHEAVFRSELYFSVISNAFFLNFRSNNLSYIFSFDDEDVVVNIIQWW